MATDLSASEKAEHIISLLNASANTPYIGEPISQLEHSLQAAYLATTADTGVDEETIIAALLHDIGQFVPENELRAVLGEQIGVQDMVSSSDEGYNSDEPSGSVGRVGHDELGAQYLSALGFSEKVARLVGSHVEAKRYLCAIDSTYYAKLSDASKKSLEFQGGPMAGTEKERFASNPWCDDMCKLRRWDDGAKIEHLEVPRSESYRDLITKFLMKQ